MATDMINGVLAHLGPQGTHQIAEALNTDDASAENAIRAALPALIGAMANNTAKPQGAQSLAGALDDHSPDVFNQLGGLLSGGGPGDAILGHVLGGKRGGVEKALAGSGGLDIGSITKLLPILAPLVMGYLSKQKKEGGLDAGGLGSMLNQERKSAEKSQPGLGGLASLLDADGDGSVMDDLAEMATGGSKGKGGFGGILSKILKR